MHCRWASLVPSVIRAHAQPGRPCPLFWPPPNPALAAQRLREAQEAPTHGQGSDAVIASSLGQVPLSVGQPLGPLAAQEWARSEEFWAVPRAAHGVSVAPVAVTAAAEAGTSGGGSAGAQFGASAGQGGQGLSPAVEQWGGEGALGQSASAFPGLGGMGRQQQQQEGGRQATSHPLLDDPDDDDDDGDDLEDEEDEGDEGEEAGEAGGVGVEEGSQPQPSTLLQAMHSAVTGAVQSAVAQLNMVGPCASYLLRQTQRCHQA